MKIQNDDRNEVELDGNPAETEWKNKDLKDRIKLVNLGGDTDNHLWLCLRDWNEDDEPGALGKNVKLSRFKDSQRTKYSLRKGGNVKNWDKIEKEVEDHLINIPEALEVRRKMNLKRAGWDSESSSSPDNANSGTVDENDAVPEDDMFEVNEDDIKPTINAGDFNE